MPRVTVNELMVRPLLLGTGKRLFDEIPISPFEPADAP